jgi:uncharacterized membrane protein YfcA
MTAMIAFVIGTIGLIIGIAVGAVGIGGVLLVPVLTLALGIEIKSAVAAALLSYLPCGILAVLLYARRGSIAWREAAILAACVAPSSWIGAQAASRAPAAVLEGAIGLLLLGGGLYTLLPPRPDVAADRVLPVSVLIGLGLITGFGSALTGAGGAFILIPLLLLLGTPVLTAIGLGQAIVVPIAGVASIANLRVASIDPKLCVLLALTLMAGIAIGTPIAHALPQQKLRRVLGCVVVLAGVAMVAKVGFRLARDA